jgi:hypothetical protein
MINACPRRGRFEIVCGYLHVDSMYGLYICVVKSLESSCRCAMKFVVYMIGRMSFLLAYYHISNNIVNVVFLRKASYLISHGTFHFFFCSPLNQDWLGCHSSSVSISSAGFVPFRRRSNRLRRML